jgi:hypothetical protein
MVITSTMQFLAPGPGLFLVYEDDTQGARGRCSCLTSLTRHHIPNLVVISTVTTYA